MNYEMTGARETLRVGNTEVAVPEWLYHITDRDDVESVDYGYAGMYLVCKCKLKNGLHFVFRDCDESSLKVNVNLNFFMDTTHRLAKKGLTHFFEHMMFKRVKLKGKYLKSETLNKKASDNGVILNAFTGTEGIVINSLVFPKELIKRQAQSVEEAGVYRDLIASRPENKDPFEDVKLLFDMVYGIAYDHKIDPKDVEDEKKVVKSEIALAKSDHWELFKASRKVIEGSRFYDFVGCETDIDDITVEDCVDLTNILINGCTDPATRHVITGNFREIPEVIDMWIETMSKVIKRKDKLGKVEEFNRHFKTGVDKLGGPKHKIENMLKRKAKTLIVEVPDSETTEMDIYAEVDFKDRKWSKYSLSNARAIVPVLITFMCNSLSAPLTKKFREELGWTYKVSPNQVPLGIGTNTFLAGWDMILGKHVPRDLETLAQAKDILYDLEFNDNLVKDLLNSRADLLLAGMDKMIYNISDHPYSDNLPLKDWNNHMSPLTDVTLEEWRYLWFTLLGSMYFILLSGTKKNGEE